MHKHKFIGRSLAANPNLAPSLEQETPEAGNDVKAKLLASVVRDV